MARRSDKPAAPHAARSPQQQRSRETLERILIAAEQQLETREFDELTMADLARHAGCAVGTVYGRVPNKESLLLCLHERYMATGMKNFARVFQQCQSAGLETRVERLTGMIVDFFASNRGVTRAITNYLFARSSEHVTENVLIFRKETTAGFKQAAAFLAARVDRRTHPAPQTAAEFGLLAISDVAQSRIVFGQRSGLQINYPPRTLKSRLTALLLGYLQHG